MAVSINTGAESMNEAFYADQDELSKQIVFRRVRAQRLVGKLISPVQSAVVNAEDYYEAALGVSLEEGLDEENPEFMSLYMASMVLQNELKQGDTIELRADKGSKKENRQVKLASFSSEQFEPIRFELAPFLSPYCMDGKWYGNAALAVEGEQGIEEITFMKVLTYEKRAEAWGAPRSTIQPTGLGVCPLSDGYIQFKSNGRIYGRPIEELNQTRVPHSVK